MQNETTTMAEPSGADIYEALDQLREWWEALSPVQRIAWARRTDGCKIAAEIGIDDQGDIWFKVFDR